MSCLYWLLSGLPFSKLIFGISKYSMKKIVSFLLAIVFALNVMGVFFIIQLRHRKIRSEIKQLIKEGIPEKDLTVITIPFNEANQLKWFKKNEFEYLGNMYDVVRQERNSKAIIYHCITDRQESALFAHINELVSQNMNSHQSRKLPVKNLLKLLSNLYSQKISFQLSAPFIKSMRWLTYNNQYMEPAIFPFSPPPRS